MSFNKIIVVGNLGRDPELKYTAQGTPVCSFTIASNERRKDKSGEPQDITTWFRGTIFGTRAETFARYMEKGKPVYIEGRLRTEIWTDREGKERTTLEINVSDFNFVGTGIGEGSTAIAATVAAGNGVSQTTSKRAAAAPIASQEPEFDDSDINF